jgi:hypothetical protein
MSKRKSLKNGSTNSENLREVVKIIDRARKRLRNNPSISHPVGLDLISAAIKLNTIIKTSKK